MKKSGEITVFLSMCLLCIWALLCVMLESARMAGSRYYFQVAAGSALDTLFSRYHRRLWEEYRIFALEYRDQDEVIQDLEQYINEYLSVNNWYPMKLETVELTQLTGIADEKGDYLAKEVLSMMKLDAVARYFMEPEEGGQFLKDVMEADSIHTLSGLYDDQERETRKLEQAVEKLVNNVQEQERMGQKIDETLAKGDKEGFFRAEERYRQIAEDYPKLMRQYERQAKALADRQQEAQFKIKEAGENLQGNREEIFRQQWNPYNAYIAQDGERRQEFSRWENETESNLRLLDETEQLVQDTSGYEGDGDDEMKREELSLKAAAELWGTRHVRTSLDDKRSSGDKEKQNLLDQVKRLGERGLLEAVIPERTIVSEAALPLDKKLLNNETGTGTEKNGGKSGDTLAERVVINEYCGNYFTNALSFDKHLIQYEMEYILQGCGTDRENLEKTVTELFAVREGMNLLHILSDAGKRKEAESLALVITGVTGLTPLVKIVACVVMGVWAMGEAIQDLRILMANGNVPLWKREGDWNTSLDNILDMGRGQMPDLRGVSEKPGAAKNGFTYEEYLKLLLLKTDPKTKHMRMLELMQMNIRWEQPGFSVENCVYHVYICGNAWGKHMFFALPVMENFVHGKKGYSLKAEGEKAY